MDLWRRRVDSDAVGTHGLRGLEGLVVGHNGAVEGPRAWHCPARMCHCGLSNLEGIVATTFPHDMAVLIHA